MITYFDMPPSNFKISFFGLLNFQFISLWALPLTFAVKNLKNTKLSFNFLFIKNEKIEIKGYKVANYGLPCDFFFNFFFQFLI
jgi:hypothetical protein